MKQFHGNGNGVTRGEGERAGRPAPRLASRRYREPSFSPPGQDRVSLSLPPLPLPRRRGDNEPLADLGPVIF